MQLTKSDFLWFGDLKASHICQTGQMWGTASDGGRPSGSLQIFHPPARLT
jgi:hypothetical protein